PGEHAPGPPLERVPRLSAVLPGRGHSDAHLRRPGADPGACGRSLAAADLRHEPDRQRRGPGERAAAAPAQEAGNDDEDLPQSQDADQAAGGGEALLRRWNPCPRASGAVSWDQRENGADWSPIGHRGQGEGGEMTQLLTPPAGEVAEWPIAPVC